MKKSILFPFVLIGNLCFAQKQLPLIKASSNKAKIYTENNEINNWNIDPKIKTDVFSTNKLTKATLIKFKTDVDSLSFKLKPGESKDFIVLLNGKDSCYTRIQSPAHKDFSKINPQIHDTIPLIINKENTIYVKAVLNAKDTLNLNFDSGTTEIVLPRNVLKNKIKSDLKLYNTPYELKIGKQTYKAHVFDTELTGHETDGRFGWDLFDGMIVELNYDKNLMIVHSKLPTNIAKDKAYSKLDIRYFSNIFLVSGTMAQSGIANKDWFLFDTGYQRTAMLDNDLLKQHKFPVEKMEVIKKVIMRGAMGNEIPVITSDLNSLKLGNHELKDVPVQVLTGNKPLKNENIHILGNEVLKRFNTILDFQHNVVYLKPNSLYYEAYTEKKEKDS
ncbi:aspartyl protease family protein [Pedobacter montanisoli]|uniref:Aspartyl protease family protein n=1 Tax=Pedobacter montanisoli TaxID=2923277 RepID=A0ABS9ZXD4_9SPHI|nr:aspartyl protease family protein [Pedobacter montanisoli]MCJ0742989.1 aspartyl protease family protein [Pedobacter montanisoli]